MWQCRLNDRPRHRSPLTNQRSAVESAMSFWHGRDDIIDCSIIPRTMLQGRNIPSLEISRILQGSMMSPEMIHYIISLDYNAWTVVDASPGEQLYPALATALRMYGLYLSETTDCRAEIDAWEAVIRRLIRNRADVHAVVPPRTSYEWEGSLLNELFLYNADVFSSMIIGEAWLNILSTEGYDVSAYLETEQALYGTEFPLLLWSDYGWRIVLFDIEDEPKTYWEYRFPSHGPGTLVCQEFSHMNLGFGYFKPSPVISYTTHPIRRVSPLLDWEFGWPFIYPEWSFDDPYNRPNWDQYYEITLKRQERRWRKRVQKAQRQNGQKSHHTMPGAWPCQ